MNDFNTDGVRQYVRRLLEAMGEDPDRDGLKDTPDRVARAWAEMLAGNHQDPAKVLAKSFDDVQGYDQMVVLAGFPFHSTCEHHLLPFSGTADVGYLPGSHVVGLSKLGRLVDVFARRLQVQERMTQQIAEALQENTGARGVGVRLSAVHSCMSCRGVKKAGCMVTESLLGDFREHAVRDEFWHLANGRTS